MKQNRIITFILVMIPIFAIYKSLIPMLSIADILLIILAIMTIFDNIIGMNKKTHLIINESRYRHLGPILLLLFFIFMTLISILISGKISLASVVLRTLRYGLFMYTVSIVGYRYFDLKYAIKLVVGISIASTIYIIIQTFAYYFFGIVLPFIIPFLDPMISEYKDISNLIDWYHQFYYRPQSFFMEPAHFSQYNLVALALSLFWKELFSEKARIKTAVFLTIGLVMSTSSIGVIIGLFFWCIFLLKSFKLKLTHKKVLLFYVMFFVMLLISPLILNTERIITPITRIFQTTARTTGSISIFSNLDILQRVLGIGLGNEELFIEFSDRIPFMNSLTIVLLSAGYFGLFAFILFFTDLLIHKKGVFRLLSMALFILSFGSEIFFTTTGIIWLLFIYYGNKEMCLTYLNNTESCQVRKS